MLPPDPLGFQATAMKHAKFKVDAALLQELGERLIGRAHIALGELIKNAYDADATECRIDFSKDRIVVSDNGHGMSETEFLDYWMRLGTTHKVETGVSRHLRRPMTGSKGIGRLSVQFLAEKMKLDTTWDPSTGHYIRATIDWTDIQKGEDISTVRVQWRTKSGKPDYPAGPGTGTRIELTGLRSTWDKHDLEELGRNVWLLNSPFPRSRTPGNLPQNEDFLITVNAPEIREAREAFEKMRSSLFGNWKARVVGVLNDGRRDGKATVTVEFRGDYPAKGQREARWVETVDLPIRLTEKPVEGSRHEVAVDRATFTILVFRPERRQKGGVPVAQMREYLREFGNVSVYDRGFRLPYYGASQDWLNIALDQGRRLSTSALLPSRLRIDGKYLLDLPSPSRIFGIVQIDTTHERLAADKHDAAPDEWLQIQAGRERLSDNLAFRQLRDLVRFTLDYYASRYRLRFLEAPEVRSKARSAPAALGRALAILEECKGALPEPVYAALRRELINAGRAARAAEANLDERAVLLAPLAAAGATALAMNHELSRETTSLRATGRRLRVLRGKLGDPELSEIADDLRRVQRRFRSLQQLFGPLGSLEDREASGRLLVRPLAQHVVTAMGPLMAGVRFNLDDVPRNLRFPVGSFAEWNAVLQNVFANCWNAMLGADETAVSLSGGRKGTNHEWLRVSDTGVGLGLPLPESSTLFEPFERRLEIPSESRSIAIGGQGLGLAIVKMIATKRGAHVGFVRADDGFSTAIELRWKGERN